MTTLLPERLILLLNNKNIDWDNNCNFNAAGKVSNFKQEALTNSFSMRCVPKGELVTSEAKNALYVLEAIMQTSTRGEFSIIFTRLSNHCGLQNKDPNMFKSMLRDYWQDLGQYPKSLIDKACDKYRRLPSGNNFMPKSGVLINLMDAEFHKMQTMHKRINIILGNVKPRVEKTNKPLSLSDTIKNMGV